MRELLADLLAYTQLTNRGPGEEPELIDLNVVLGQAVENCKAAREESRAVTTAERLPTIRGHNSHFSQLFQNLIGNAIKYRSEGIPRISISAEKRDDHWCFAVSDNGIGTASEYHESDFAVFKRLHGKNVPGTGIVLAICQRVVECYGGRIWVESEEGQRGNVSFYGGFNRKTEGGPGRLNRFESFCGARQRDTNGRKNRTPVTTAP
jgi:light-regulated signal transduction histidine kinase (bacteriophytochrome)